MDLGGRTALLTGATGGLGRAIATALAARGARLILSSGKTEELVKLARSPGRGDTTLVSDLAEEGAALALLEQAGNIDVLVANAALPASGLLESFSQDEVGRALRVNLESPVRMTRELLPRWAAEGRRGASSSSPRSRVLSLPHGRPSTRPRSSACGASRSIYEKTCAATGLVFP